MRPPRRSHALRWDAMRRLVAHRRAAEGRWQDQPRAGRMASDAAPPPGAHRDPRERGALRRGGAAGIP
eukprot:2186389-Pyramimonas_sp.AAC.1